MSELNDLYNRIAQTNEKLIKKWQREVNKRIKRFVRNIAKASPFLDKPNKRMFGIRNSKDGKSLTIYGTSPNAGRVKGFNAPVNEWKKTDETYRIFGEGEWRTIHKVQMVRASAGVPVQDVSYYGTSNCPERYFGIKKGRVILAYGKTKDDLSLPVYAKANYPDWIMNNHREEIERIIMEAGRDVLGEMLNR